MAEAQFWIGIHAVIVERGRMLLLRRAQSMTYRPGCWDLPGGHLAADETFEQCLVREVAEETGLAVEIERLITVNKSDGPYAQIFYLCRPAGEAREAILRSYEHSEWRWAAPAELAELGELIPYLERIIARGLLDWVGEEMAVPRGSRDRQSDA